MTMWPDDFDELDKQTSETVASLISRIAAATDFDALLANIHAGANHAEATDSRNLIVSRPPDDERGGVHAVCDHIDMLNAVLEAAAAHEMRSPVVATLYLSTARRSLRRLRSGLIGRHLAKGEALRLIGNVEHNLGEADDVLRSEHGLSLDGSLRERIGDLMELGDDIAAQVRALGEKVAQLFDETTEPAVLTPVPQQ